MSSMTANQNFAAALGALKAGYPSHKPHPKEWESTLRVWFDRLKNYPPRVINAAVWRAQKSHPEWFPTLGQFDSVCSELAKTSLAQEPNSRAGYLPRTTQGREAYLLEAGSPFEQLARLWELEDSARPNRATPPEEGTVRFKQFWATWDKHAAWAAERKKGVQS